MQLELKGRNALVTGGSRGIGRAITLALARQGVNVVACYRQRSEAVESLAREAQELGNITLVQADVCREEDVARLFETCRERFERLDIVVNNAGAISHIPLSDLTPAEWHRMLDTNLTSIYLVVREALPLLSEGASVINVGSSVATRGMAACAHYTASKAGIIGLTRSLCKELGPRGIRVNTLAPGIIETDMVSRLTPEQRKKYEAMAAVGRLGQPEDIAGAVLYLASDLSRFVSGITLEVNGGI
ncbi:SDR family NAD(P)-dependent oxidoreductase [Melittangium boletus]|uniref:Short-chain dehydrogenase n=1 Tax=Melittangium boletus DSM 14713 TaxID=1294270 RepID=A0A250ICL4_9BACT|nr:3-oxoacyl-ACP reductase family protein [Melittangium boletus]ATB29589.1 short-chain dehydrogenase [Melittangium boletus DSM 14713]